MTRAEWAGCFAGVAGLAFAAEAAISVGRSVASAFADAPPLVKLGCVAAAAALVLAFLQAEDDSAGPSRRA